MGPEPSCKVLEQDGCCHHRLKPDRAHVSSFKGNVQSQSLLRTPSWPAVPAAGLGFPLLQTPLFSHKAGAGGRGGFLGPSRAGDGCWGGLASPSQRPLSRSGPFPAAPGRPPAAEVSAPARAARGGGVRDGGGAAPPRRAGRETQLRAAPWRRRAMRRGSFSPRYHGAGVLFSFPGPQPRPRSYRAGAGLRGRWGSARPGQDGAVVWGVGQRVINVVLRGVLGSANGRLCCVLLSSLDGLRKRELTCRCFGSFQRLKAAVHYTVGCLCQDVAENKEVQFSKQTIAAIAEITFRQCGRKFAYYLFVQEHLLEKWCLKNRSRHWNQVSLVHCFLHYIFKSKRNSDFGFQTWKKHLKVCGNIVWATCLCKSGT